MRAYEFPAWSLPPVPRRPRGASRPLHACAQRLRAASAGIDAESMRSGSAVNPFCAIALVTVLFSSTIAAGKQPVKPPNALGKALQPRSGPADDAPVLIEPSAPILNLFTRAQEGIDRRDWKFAIDSLQRIIDDPGGSLLPRDESVPSDIIVYESTRRRALRVLRDLPPEALSAYRILYDGRAKGLYQRAVADGDMTPLRQIIDQYPLTRYGDDACDTLASWLIDEGRYGETIDVIHDCLTVVQEFDVPRYWLEGKLAAALAAMGRQSEALSVVGQSKRELDGSKPLPGWVDAIPDGTIKPDQTGEALDADSSAFIVSTPGPMAPAPPVHATLVDPVPWRYELPGDAALIWKRIVHDAPDDPVMIPAVHAVSDGTHLFVRRPNGCAALGLDDLEVDWTSSSTVAARPRGVVVGGDAREAWAVGGGFEDFVGGSLSLAEGLLFTIEQRGGPNGGTAGQVQALVRQRRVFRPRVTAASRLVAYDPGTGDIVWQRGRTFDADDSLGEVEFRSAPLGVDGRLWVPIVVQSDLFVCVLDPSDGSVVKRILLGSFQNFDRLRGRALEPTERDGLVFIPSSRGVLFAVDAHTMTLRWATRYAVPEPVVETWHQQQLRIRGRNNRTPVESPTVKPTNRLPAAPVARRGLVLVLSETDDELIALAASSGALRWSVPAPQVSYIIGADDNRVWLGGRSIQCVSLVDGTTVWGRTIDPAPTGWAVLAGDLVHVPTPRGLLTLDANAGTRVRLDTLPKDQTPLGNLLAVEDALFSVEPSSVRKFPDIERSYARAKQRYADRPNDVRSATALAWMYLFRGEPSSALGVLAKLPASAVASAARRADAVAHLRVISLHAMARETDRNDQEALALLEQARSLSRSASDRLRSGLAVADRQHTLGRNAEAYESLWTLGLSDPADATITINDAVKTAARLEIARRMRSLEPEVPTSTTVQITDQGMALAERAASDARSKKGAVRLASIAVLRAMAELATPPPVSARALLDWANLESEARRYERADQLLRWCARLSTDTPYLPAALLQLYAVYRAEIGPRGTPTLDILHVLERDFSSKTVSPELAERIDFEGAPRVGTTIGAWVRTTHTETNPPSDQNVSAPSVDAEARQADLTSAWTLTPKTFQSDRAESPFPLVGDLRQALLGVPAASTPRLIYFDEPAPSFLHDRVLFHAGGDVIYCQRSSDGALLWQTSLREPQEFSESVDVNRGHAQDRVRRAVSDGQVVVVNGTDGLYALGLLTGRRLWMRPYESRSRPGTEAPLDWRMSAGNGLLAAMPHNGRLTVMRLLDGSTVWERDLRGEIVATVTLSNNRVLTAGPQLERVLVFDSGDGAEVARHVFHQPDPKSRPVMLVQTGPVICGPDVTDKTDAVVALRLEDGSEAWRITLPKPIVGMFEPAPGLIGVGLLGGNLMVIEAETGTILLNQHLPGVQRVSDGRMIDATLLVSALTLQTARRQPALIALDLTSGDELWRRTDLPQGPSTSLPLVVNGGLTAAVVAYDEPALNQNRKRLGLALIDARTGETRALARDVLPPRSRSQLNGDVAVFNNGVVLGTTLGVQAFRVETMTKPDAATGETLDRNGS